MFVLALVNGIGRSCRQYRLFAVRFQRCARHHGGAIMA
jgi:hypothetical protein